MNKLTNKESAHKLVLSLLMGVVSMGVFAKSEENIHDRDTYGLSGFEEEVYTLPYFLDPGEYHDINRWINTERLENHVMVHQPSKEPNSKCGDNDLKCSDDEIDLGTITVSGSSPGSGWWGGLGGGRWVFVGGSGGGFSPPRNVPNNPNNGEPDATCGDSIGIRVNHARGDIGPILLTLRRGNVLRVTYANGQTELVIFVTPYSQVPVVPIPGTCGG